MPIKLNNIKNISTIIKTKYGKKLCDMNFVFCFKKKMNSYFIFQEIQGLPIQRIVYHDSNNSVTFVAGQSAWGNPYALVADANYDKIGVWKDLQDRSRPYNSYIEVDGGFNNHYWKSVNRKNRTEKKRKLKTKTDTFIEFRIDKLERAVFKEWGFELYSPTISMIGYYRRSDFPYNVVDSDDNKIENNNYEIVEDPDGDGPPDLVKVTWQGKSFNITSLSPPSHNVQCVDDHINYDKSSYWDKNDNDNDNKLFDEEIARVLLDNREEDETILDIGQREITLDFGDDD